MMGSGSSFSVNTIVSRSVTNANDFYFTGKTKSLTDGTKTKTFLSSVGFVMKAITTNQDETCFSFSTGYALSLQNTLLSSLISVIWNFSSYTYTYSTPTISSLPASSYNKIVSRTTNSTTNQIWCTKSPYLILNSAGIKSSIIY